MLLCAVQDAQCNTEELGISSVREAHALILSIHELASRQIQAIQSQKTRLEPRPHVKYLHSQKWKRAGEQGYE